MREQKQQLRIIGGQWRGRKLPIATVDGLRPTGDRIRETLFNWLMADIVDSHCLDLFAGSGALGFECLSRGAASATLLEKHPQGARQLQANCHTLSSPQANIVQCDALAWLQNSSLGKNSVDIAFIDPPFAANLWDSVINSLHKSGLLTPTPRVYIEAPKSQVLSIPSHWRLHKEKRAGQVAYRLFELS